MRCFALYGFVLLLALNSCRDCPPGDELGEISLGAAARDFWPYQANDTVPLVNELGERRFLISREEFRTAYSPICVRSVCAPSSAYSVASCDHYTAESRRFNYFMITSEAFSIPASFLVILYSGLHERHPADFFDAVRIRLYSSQPFVDLGHVIEQRFPGELDPSKTGIGLFLKPMPEVSIHGRRFVDVLGWESGNDGVYIQPGLGLVGLRAYGTTWVRE